MSKPTPLTLAFPLLSLLVAAPGCASDADSDPDDSPSGADAGSTTPPDDDPDPPDDPVPPDAAPPPAFALSGDVTGAEIPADAEVVALWAVFTGSDHATKWGDGTSSGSHFDFVLSEAPPPPLAMNDFGGDRRLGIGFLVLVPTGTALPDGVVDPDQEVDLLGNAIAPIIWREGAMGGDLSWTNAFDEETYQCGRCVPATDDETFDHFEPIDCSEVDIATPRADIDCNFT